MFYFQPVSRFQQFRRHAIEQIIIAVMRPNLGRGNDYSDLGFRVLQQVHAIA
jgi:hypothetical protein